MDSALPYICRCILCQKNGPLYSSMNKYDNNSFLKPECVAINEIESNKKKVINIGSIFIILFLLISSKNLKYNKYI